jgi:hypothetical protein
MISPIFQKHAVDLHWMDLVALIAVSSTLALAFWWQVRRHSLVPVRDPRLEQGLEFHNT